MICFSFTTVNKRDMVIRNFCKNKRKQSTQENRWAKDTNEIYRWINKANKYMKKGHSPNYWRNARNITSTLEEK